LIFKYQYPSIPKIKIEIKAMAGMQVAGEDIHHLDNKRKLGPQFMALVWDIVTAKKENTVDISLSDLI
jgi:hypothetical protein